MEHVRVVLAPVLKLREIDCSGKAVGDVTEVLELAELAHRGLHQHLPILLALVHHRVAHGGEDWPRLAGIVGQGSLHVPLVEFDFRHRTGQGPGEDVALVLHRKVVRVRRAHRDPDRGMGFLQRLRHRGRGRKGPVLAPVFVVALPQSLHRRQHLAPHVPVSFRTLQTGVQAVELAPVGAGADAELKSTAAVEIQQRRLALRP